MKNFRLICRLFLLCALAVPFSNLALAASPGDECTQGEVGKTELSTDRANIIGCLVNDGGSPPYIWKSFSSSGGGMTGGCVSDNYGNHGYIWGRGCLKHGFAPGYACGQIAWSITQGQILMVCVNQ